MYTVNSEIFAKFFFCKTQSFVKIKSSRNGEITLSFIDVGKSYIYTLVANFKRGRYANLAKKFEFTVLSVFCRLNKTQGYTTEKKLEIYIRS